MESLSENAVDGFVSPIFWYAILGLPGVVLFKVISTMDSMVGLGRRHTAILAGVGRGWTMCSILFRRG